MSRAQWKLQNKRRWEILKSSIKYLVNVCGREAIEL
jgi:hypothetical protein